MQIKNNIIETIGETPLIKLNNITKGLNANIYAKLEFMNPGGSVKDRMAKYIVEEAEKKGLLKPGGTIVESSSGNTGAALAMIAAAKGYTCIIVMPDKMSREKQQMMKALGAQVIITKTDVPADSPESYYNVAKRIAKEKGAFYPDQYNNENNPQAHYLTTGPEIWKQCKGKIDVIIAGIGTGGTLSGVGKYLKKKNPKIHVIAVDPFGSIFYDYFKSKKLITPHTYKVEGIGEDYLVKALKLEVIDDMIQVNDKDSFITARRLACEEGIFAGGSSGSAVWAALEYTKIFPSKGKKKNILVILPDSGSRYLSKFYDDEWLKKNIL